MKANPGLVALIERALMNRGGRAVGREIRFRCPAHDDHHPSARWNRDKHVWHCDVCKAGGRAQDLAAHLGLELSTAAGGLMPRETVYPVRNAQGQLIAEHVRIEGVGARKTFAWRRDGRRGLSGLPVGELPLYGAERVVDFDRSRSVFLTEGEKAAEGLHRLGVSLREATSSTSRAPERPKFTGSIWRRRRSCRTKSRPSMGLAPSPQLPSTRGAINSSSPTRSGDSCGRCQRRVGRRRNWSLRSANPSHWLSSPRRIDYSSQTAGPARSGSSL